MADSIDLNRLKENWQRVQDEVLEAAENCGRDPNTIRVIGVSKYVDISTTEALFEAGCGQLGESRPQSLWEKAEALESADVHWHLIGHLQRNKVRRTIRCRATIHSIDSQRLLNSVAQESDAQGLQTPVLLEVNISGDDAKTGFAPQELLAVLNQLPKQGVQMMGLMAMAGRSTAPEDAQKQFDQTRLLRDQLQQQTGLSLPELSMGMSGDFPQAIAAGATMIRVGSRLFS